NNPASWVGLPCQSGANCLNSFVLRKATICSGTGMFTFALVISVEKTARICSKRMATSRPRFSPASVTTEKWGERSSTHCGPSALATGRRQNTAASSKRRKLNHKRRVLINTATYRWYRGKSYHFRFQPAGLSFDQQNNFLPCLEVACFIATAMNV